MKVTVYGAAREVTGSCYLLSTRKSKLLIDCGLFQGSKKLERLNFIPKELRSLIRENEISAVLLTHGHLDHSGRLPLLVKAGYRGPIYSTEGSAQIAALILEDAAHVQENDIERENRKRLRAGLKAIKPIFDIDDVDNTIKLFKTKDLNYSFIPAEGISAQFLEAGHILGSTSIKLHIKESNQTIVFSGDLGPFNMPIMPDPALIEDVDIVFVESTYGHRNHRTHKDTLDEFANNINKTRARGGKILIPTFAIGRAQQLLYYLSVLIKTNKIKPLPVYIDSPMAIRATEIYAKHADLLDEDAGELIREQYYNQNLFPLKTCLTPQESIALNNIEGPCIIMAGAGMCNAGRILHHLKHNAWQEKNAIIIVGFQAKGSLGRALVEGTSKVKIFGETIMVKAEVSSIGGFSAHAGQTDLLHWLESICKGAPKIVLTHGEVNHMNEFSYQIKNKFAINALIPELEETLTL